MIGAITWLIAEGETLVPLAPALWLGLPCILLIPIFVYMRARRRRRKLEQEENEIVTGEPRAEDENDVH